MGSVLVRLSGNKPGYDCIRKMIFRRQDDDVTGLSVGGTSRKVTTGRHYGRKINADLRLPQTGVTDEAGKPAAGEEPLPQPLDLFRKDFRCAHHDYAGRWLGAGAGRLADQIH